MVFHLPPPSTLPSTDKRYQRWRRSLKKRPAVWNKGLNKKNNFSVAKISETFKKKKIDNFKEWRLRMILQGKFHDSPKELEKTKELAELIGVILGDGNIHAFPRTEALTIASNASNKGFIERYSKLVYKIFSKQPTINKIADGCIKIRIYQKYLSVRLGIPSGNRGKMKIRIPDWILDNEENLIAYLRGLYEAEGSFCIHKPTCTYKFLFANKNKSLLDNVYNALKILGFNPHRGKYQIQISRREEVYKIKDLVKFRQY